MNTAFEQARRGTCSRGKNGAAIVSYYHQVVSAGYNGAPRGLPHCLDKGCLMGPGGSCIRAVHAELNAIVNAAFLGVGTNGHMMYSTHRPCLRVCAPAIINAGIIAVAWSLPYSTDNAEEEVVRMFESCSIRVYKLVGEDDAPYVPSSYSQDA
jgi:dCMP deaminase